jgi:hypothetical protein
MINVYSDGGSLALTIPLVDSAGQTVIPTAVEYALLGSDDVEILARTAVTFTDGDTDVYLTTTALQNTMAAIGDVNDAAVLIKFKETREVVLYMTTTTGEVVGSYLYVLERAAGQLMTGVNSFQTYKDGQMNSLEIPDTLGWDSSEKADRVSALLESHRRIAQLYFRVPVNDMSKINYSFSLSKEDIKVSELGKDEYDNLPAKFKIALALAQIAEADYILESDELEEQRDSGILSFKVGESEHTFRSSKSVENSVSKKSMKYLRPYINTSVGLRRG